ncbi:glycosyltransferase family 4 protein [Tardiphaga alba]|uniref:Glycosyltransferase family 4 protein n=1 Tax=Tardiphaga alba TaxID=340268 RepID=A0ABX8ACD6_9BRAD|nr:glycosyltransferase family 4 protein [Tardiphaga alba]QUS39470.1 glycosyltransferase family 4 protein [Tardiphaga alba]
MKIAQIAPLAESCPPKLYGGTERIVSYLTEELVRLGHEVTLFASGDSVTNADLVPCAKTALRLDPTIRDMLPYHIAMLDEVSRRLDDFDIVHFHIDYLHYPMMRPFADRMLTTLHGRLDLPDAGPFYKAFPELPLVSISDAQRAPMPPVNWLATIYHGLPKDLLPFNPAPTCGYAAFLGRISPEKRPDRAIEIAARAGIPLKMAAKVDQADRKYWDDVIGPMVEAHSNVEFVGEINEHQKAEFLGNATALLFPIDWPEPFGLVMIEAMACGTPVIAFANGSVPEIIDDGLTGFVVGSTDDAVSALQNINRLPRAAVRRQFEERFTVERMTQDYLAAYRHLRPDVRPTLELVSA